MVLEAPLNSRYVHKALISYTLGEDVATASIKWINGRDESGQIVDALKETTLTGPDLAAGTHMARDLSAEISLVNGAEYDQVLLEVQDSAGNIANDKSYMVKVGSTPEAIVIEGPPSVNIKIGDIIIFNVRGLDIVIRASQTDTNFLDVDSIVWAVIGPGKIDSTGSFVQEGMGESQVIASLGSLKDTVRVSVTESLVRLPEASDEGDSINIVEDVILILPAAVVGQGVSITIKDMPPYDIPAQLTLSGPAISFSEKTLGFPVDIRFELDTSLIPDSVRLKVQVYRLVTVGVDKWLWVPSNFDGGSLIISTDTLGTYIVAIDNSPPALLYKDNPSTSMSGEALRVSYKDMKDNIANAEVRLRYRIGGQASDSVIFLGTNKDGFYEFPAGIMNAKGLWYRLEAVDGSNTTVLSAVDVAVEITQTMAYPSGDKTLAGGVYNMFSIPLVPKDNSIAKVLYDDMGDFDAKKWRVYKYEDGVFKEMVESVHSRLLPGYAYWLRTVKGMDVVIDLDSGTASSLPAVSEVSVPLFERWNCISNPFPFPVSLQAVDSATGAEFSFVYEWDGQTWLTTDSITALEPWKGYLLWNGHTGAKKAENLLIPPVEFIPPAPKIQAKSAMASAGSKPVCIGIRATSGGLMDGQIRAIASVNNPAANGPTNGDDQNIGLARLSSATVRNYPRPDIFDKKLKIYLTLDGNPNSQYLTDVRKDMGDGQSWDFSVANFTGDPDIELDFSGLEDLPKGVRAILADPGNNTYFPVNGNKLPYIQEAPGTRLFKLIVGGDDYVRANIRGLSMPPNVFSMSQNFPNPFGRSITQIQYALPLDQGRQRQYRVELSIYDLQGRLLRQLVEGYQFTGEYTQIWDGRDASGSMLPSGTYFYRLQAGRFRAQKKMVVLE